MKKLLALILSVMLAIPFTLSSAAATSTASKSAPGSFGKYTPGITITTVRVLDSDTKFDTKKPTQASITKNVWASAYKEKLGVTFKYLWTPTLAQYDTKWNVAIASGDIPDMAVVSTTIYKELLDSNLVHDMTDIFNKYASPLYKKCQKDDGGISMKYMTLSGRLYGIPQNGNQPDGMSIAFIRNDWLKKVNMTKPKTIDQLFTVLKAFKDAKLGGDNTIPWATGAKIYNGGDDLQGFINGYGAFPDTWIKLNNGTIGWGSIQPAMNKALLGIQKFYKAGLIRTDFAVDASGDKAHQDLSSGRSGFCYGNFSAPLWPGMMGSITGDKTSDWEPFECPTVDGTPYKSFAPNCVPGWFVFVKKGCKYPEAAVKVSNLDLQLFQNDPEHYRAGPDGNNVAKYRFNTELFVPWLNLNTYRAITKAMQTGNYKTLNAYESSNLDSVKKGMSGDRTGINQSINIVFGKVSTFGIVNNLYNSNRIVTSAYKGLPTETMAAKQNDLTNSLNSAMLKVILGDSINTFTKAVNDWKANGGNTMTKEANGWYAKNK